MKNPKDRFKVGQRVVIATYCEGNPKQSRIDVATIEKDNACQWEIEAGHGSSYMIQGHGVYTAEQVFSGGLEAVNWLRSRIDQRVGELMAEAHRQTQRSVEISAMWIKIYEARDGLEIPTH